MRYFLPLLLAVVAACSPLATEDVIRVDPQEGCAPGKTVVTVEAQGTDKAWVGWITTGDVTVVAPTGAPTNPGPENIPEVTYYEVPEGGLSLEIDAASAGAVTFTAWRSAFLGFHVDEEVVTITAECSPSDTIPFAAPEELGLTVTPAEVCCEGEEEITVANTGTEALWIRLGPDAVITGAPAAEEKELDSVTVDGDVLPGGRHQRVPAGDSLVYRVRFVECRAGARVPILARAGPDGLQRYTQVELDLITPCDDETVDLGQVPCRVDWGVDVPGSPYWVVAGEDGVTLIHRRNGTVRRLPGIPASADCRIAVMGGDTTSVVSNDKAGGIRLATFDADLQSTANDGRPNNFIGPGSASLFALADAILAARGDLSRLFFTVQQIQPPTVQQVQGNATVVGVTNGTTPFNQVQGVAVDVWYDFRCEIAYILYAAPEDDRRWMAHRPKNDPNPAAASPTAFTAEGFGRFMIALGATPADDVMLLYGNGTQVVPYARGADDLFDQPLPPIDLTDEPIEMEPLPDLGDGRSRVITLSRGQFEILDVVAGGMFPVGRIQFTDNNAIDCAVAPDGDILVVFEGQREGRVYQALDVIGNLPE